MSDREVVLVGYSGHGYVVADAAVESGLFLLGYTETKQTFRNPFNLNYLGYEMDPNFKEWTSDKQYILGIGDNNIRQKVANYIISKNGELLNVIHPLSSISKTCKMGFGNFISKNVSINPLVTIGDLCIINTGSIVEHECTLGNGVHIAPGAVLAGNVSVGDFTFVGANAVIKQGVKIGKNVVVGAGTVVIRDIEDNELVVGNPGKKI
ncbi:acetyltransferase [Algoriphagus chordae]|uniref:Sugar O-acyltransferase (Sialic acid O-acetyltransferase NeuD family) n=1 Tax=Algoriphagus chordae TaxID=237019 RepID=A0A2W7R076_9BACT|nr:acetyltransferase [Algoriphagus chordae]PZX54203.1 sugar O-acyltransferase (sialic acid O-acetyltransferase NeuD family) [Algoriphagus chordae]